MILDGSLLLSYFDCVFLLLPFVLYECFFLVSLREKIPKPGKKLRVAYRLEKRIGKNCLLLWYFKYLPFGWAFHLLQIIDDREMPSRLTLLQDCMTSIEEGLTGRSTGGLREVYGRSMGGLQTRPPVLKCPVHRHFSQKRELSAKKYTFSSSFSDSVTVIGYRFL